MLKIRLQRTGRKHEPTFRLVVTESRRGPKSGDFIEILGNHDPRQEERTQLKGDRIRHWISKGAQLSDTVHNLLVQNKIIGGVKVNVLPRKQPQISEAAAAKEEVAAAEGAVKEAADDSSKGAESSEKTEEGSADTEVAGGDEAAPEDVAPEKTAAKE